MNNQETETTIEIDAPEGYIEAKAYFEIYNDKATLYRWDFNGRKQSRDTFIKLAGITECLRIEELVMEEWYEQQY